MNNQINQQNNSQKKRSALIATFGLIFLYGGTYLAVKNEESNVQEYVITDKGANKIVYHSIANPGVNHVMTFDGDTVFQGGGFYPYLSVGDTITGNTRFMNEPVNYSLYYQDLRRPVPMTTIRTARGHTLNELREIARRDSLMREIKTKQR